jgi:hypothetical protein
MRTSRTTLMLAALCLLCTSCALPKRRPLEIGASNAQLSSTRNERLIATFEPSVSGKPLNETVWDNVSGPFWDKKESKQIGFTQNYKPQFFLIPPPLLPAVAKNGAGLVDSQIVIPFGNIFTTLFDSAAQRSFSKVVTCFEQDCAKTSESSAEIRVKIEKFLVWEAPLNHINFHINGTTAFFSPAQPKKEYSFQNELLNQKLGTVMSTHNSFIREMNKIADQFADQTVQAIFEKAF